MAWLGLISLGLVAELATIIVLGRTVTDRYEAAHEPVPPGADDDVPGTTAAGVRRHPVR
jgi:hypothetical protein